MRASTKRIILLVLAVLTLLDIVIAWQVLTRDDKAPAAQPAASATRTAPNVVPLRVTPPIVANDTPSPTPTASRVAPAPPATNDTPTPEATPGDKPPPRETPTPKAPAPADDDPPDSTDGSQPVIQVNGAEFAARPFETVRMVGTYIGPRARTILRVQQRQGGHWVDFPLPTVTDDSGDFTAYVELGSLGEHRVRIVDPGTNTVSKSVIVVIS